MIIAHFFNVMDYINHLFFRFKNIVFVLLFLLFPTLSYSKTLIVVPLEDGFLNTNSKVFSSSTVRVFKISNKVNEFMDIDSYPDYVDISYQEYVSLSKYLANDSFSLGSSILIKPSSSSSSSPSIVDLAYYTLRYPDSFINVQELPAENIEYLKSNSNSYSIRGSYYSIVYKALSSLDDSNSVVIYTALKDPSVLEDFWAKELTQGKIKRLPVVISLYDPRLNAFALNFSTNFFDTSSRIKGLITKLIDDLNRMRLDPNEKSHYFMFASDFNDTIGQDIYKVFQSKLRSGMYSIDFSIVERNRKKSKTSNYWYYLLNSDGTYTKINSDSVSCPDLFTGG